MNSKKRPKKDPPFASHERRAAPEKSARQRLLLIG